MRQRLLQVLGTEEGEDVMTDIVRRFWTRAKPLRQPMSTSVAERRPAAQVVDLATWMRGRRPASF
jgi:hypothetical protein